MNDTYVKWRDAEEVHAGEHQHHHARDVRLRLRPSKQTTALHGTLTCQVDSLGQAFKSGCQAVLRAVGPLSRKHSSAKGSKQEAIESTGCFTSVVIALSSL